MSLREAAMKRFGAAAVEALESCAGCHAGSGGSAAPAGENRLLFGILEAIDFECPTFDWGCPGRGAGKSLAGISLADLRAFLTEHREAVLASGCPPPSWIGVMAGSFDFLEPKP